MAEAGQNGGGFIQSLKNIVTGQGQQVQKTEIKAVQVPQTPQEWDQVFEEKVVTPKEVQTPDEKIRAGRIEAQQEENRLAKMKDDARKWLAQHPKKTIA